jgi:hypothetical protein
LTLIALKDKRRDCRSGAYDLTVTTIAMTVTIPGGAKQTTGVDIAGPSHPVRFAQMWRRNGALYPTLPIKVKQCSVERISEHCEGG